MKKGFTLVEIMAVIILLGIISVIVYPYIGKAVDNSKRSSFKLSAEGIYQSIQQDNLLNSAVEAEYHINGGSLYKTSESGQWFDNPVFIKTEGSIDGQGESYVDENGNILVIISNDNYCAMNTLDNSEMVVFDGNCDDIYNEWTPDYCFEFENNTILNYTCGENGGTVVFSSKLASQMGGTYLDVVIPFQIDGQSVKFIDRWAFEDMGIESVDFRYVPNLLYIGEDAFANNNITKLDFTNNKKLTITSCSFRDNPLEEKNIKGLNNIKVSYCSNPN